MVRAYQRRMPTAEIARVFDVSPASARWVKQRLRDAGEATLLKLGSPSIRMIDREHLAALVEQQPDDSSSPAGAGSSSCRRTRRTPTPSRWCSPRSSNCCYRWAAEPGMRSGGPCRPSWIRSPQPTPPTASSTVCTRCAKVEGALGEHDRWSLSRVLYAP